MQLQVERVRGERRLVGGQRGRGVAGLPRHLRARPQAPRLGGLGRALRQQGLPPGPFEATNEAIRRASLRPVVDRVFPIEQARAAYEHPRSGAHFGKIVIAVRAAATPPRRVTPGHARLEGAPPHQAPFGRRRQRLGLDLVVETTTA